MTVLSRLVQRTLTPQQVWGADLDWAAGNTNAGITVTAASALRDEAVWAAIRLLTFSISTMPVAVLRRAGDRRIPQPDPPWFQRPDPLTENITGVDHFAQVVVSLLTDGNAFVSAQPGVRAAEFVVVLAPSGVQIKGGTYTTRTSEYDSDTLIHIPYFTRPGETRGLNPIDAAKESIGLSLAAQEFGSRFFSNGATMKGLVEAPADMTPPARKNLVDAINESHQGVKKSHLIGILTGGAKFRELTVSPKDSQLIELRKFQIESVARIFGIPPHKLASQEPGAVGYASIEQRDIDYVASAVMPLVVKIERAYSRTLPGDQYLKFNLSSLLRGDQKSRYEAYSVALQNKFMTRDEVRAFEDLEPFGDERGGLLETPNNNPPAERDEAGPDVSPDTGAINA